MGDRRRTGVGFLAPGAYMAERSDGERNQRGKSAQEPEIPRSSNRLELKAMCGPTQEGGTISHATVTLHEAANFE